ncbi:hypothetical protein NL676_022296 [Syzygium grande]|nr:hypothetical protein NL676_022296 [Syzygium grande]
MAPPNDPAKPLSSVLRTSAQQNHFDLSEGKLSVDGVPVLTEVPSNVSLTHFSSTRRSSDAPLLPLLLRVDSTANRGCFLGFAQEKPSDRLVNSLGKFSDREFLSIFRFKTWWSTMWVGSSGSDLQMETQWVLLNVPESSSYVLIVPIIEGGLPVGPPPGAGRAFQDMRGKRVDAGDRLVL